MNNSYVVTIEVANIVQDNMIPGGTQKFVPARYEEKHISLPLYTFKMDIVIRIPFANYLRCNK